MDESEFKERLERAFARPSKYEGFGYRMVAQKYANESDIISIAGSLKAGGRYNFKGKFGIVYTATNPHTCVEEALRATVTKEADIVASLPRTIIGIKIRLSRVLDMTNPAVRRQLGIKKRLLIQPGWEYEQDVLNREAVTQVIGRLAKDVGFEGLLAPSAVWPSGKNLNIYPDRLQPGSILQPENTDQLVLKT